MTKFSVFVTYGEPPNDATTSCTFDTVDSAVNCVSAILVGARDEAERDVSPLLSLVAVRLGDYGPRWVDGEWVDAPAGGWVS